MEDKARASAAFRQKALAERFARLRDAVSDGIAPPPFHTVVAEDGDMMIRPVELRPSRSARLASTPSQSCAPRLTPVTVVSRMPAWAVSQRPRPVSTGTPPKPAGSMIRENSACTPRETAAMSASRSVRR